MIVRLQPITGRPCAHELSNVRSSPGDPAILRRGRAGGHANVA